MNDSHYQVVILGSGRTALGATLESDIAMRIGDLGEDLKAALRILGTDEQPDPRSPAVAAYLGGDPTIDAQEVERLLANGVPVIPVVSHLDRYRAETPACLHPINGTVVDPADPDFTNVVNVTFENLGLLRRARRLFLSYRRTESTPVAQQLRHAFDSQGYDAFLDTNSVPKADPFQSVLWHRLLDSDVMVVLATSDFLGSKYCDEEIAQAAALTVGMLQVLWPGVEIERFAGLVVPMQLEHADFEGHELTADAVARIVAKVEQLRARCLAARHNNLVGEFCVEARAVGANAVVQPSRFVLAEMPDGRRIAAIPAVGVPDARRYQEASARFPTDGQDATEAVLIYDDRGMLREWSTFLDWLDGFLPVKSLRVTDTAVRLGKS